MDNFVITNLGSSKSKSESWNIYEILRNSFPLYMKPINLECLRITACIEHSLSVVLDDTFLLHTGSRAEGTNITPHDYHIILWPSLSSGYLSDADVMNVLYDMRVIDEGEALPQEFDNYIYCRAERGKHTSDGFRKLRIVHNPKSYFVNQGRAWVLGHAINLAIEGGYISSARLVAISDSPTVNIPWKHFIQNGLGTKGPSNIIKRNGSTEDMVKCFYVKKWPKEAEPWFKRQTHWPDKQLKNKIKKIGHLLVPTGNSKSQESNLEWRCSFSIAEALLLKSVTKFQRYTFIMLKVLIKEYLPSDINTDGKKQLLSTYHMKTLYFWCLEDRILKWEPEYMLENIYHMLGVLLRWIKKEDFPHYFIPSVNLFDRRRIHGRKNSIKRIISAIRNDLTNKIRQSKFFRSQAQFFRSQAIEACISFKRKSEAQLFVTCCDVIKSPARRLKCLLHSTVFNTIQYFDEVKFSHIELLDGLIHINYDQGLQVEHLYRGLYTDPIHDKLLTEVVPGLIKQYRGCIFLSKYCIAERDGLVYTNILPISESLLNDTLYVDPCSGYVKLACLYIATGDFVQAMKKMDVAENHFLYTHKRMRVFAQIASGREGVEDDKITIDFMHQIFQEWVEGNVASDIAVTWPEYIIVPDLLQFELIHESRQQVIDEPPDLQRKMVGLDCHLLWPPLSMIKLLKFVCALNMGRSPTSHLEKLVADLIASSLSRTVCLTDNDVYRVFNMATWCYLKIKMYRRAICMMRLAIVTRPQARLMKTCVFCHHFLAYVIAQCIL